MAPISPPGEVPPSAPTVRRLTFSGRGGTLFGIHVVNLLLTLVTLGVYYFWARVRVRAYLLSQSEFEGDRLAYHGTGQELLLGWLRAAVIFGVPILLLTYGPGLLGAGLAVQVGAGVLIYAIVMLFIPVAVVGARRYRLSRMSWRGIRFSFRGLAIDGIKLYLGGWLLSATTLGLYYPFFLARRQEFLVSHSYFGNERFRFDGRGNDLFGIYSRAFVLLLGTWIAAAALAAIVTAVMETLLVEVSAMGRVAWMVGVTALLGLVATLCAWVWLEVLKQRYLWAHTAFATARFHSSLTTGPLLRLRLVNAVLLLVTLGFAWPWVTVRNVRFLFRYLSLVGPLDLVPIEQQAQEATALGEGLAGFLDAGFDLA